MRIAEINDIASVASELSGGLRARGHYVEVIRPRLLGGSLPWMVKPVVGPVRAAEWAQIIRELRNGRFDVIHIHYAYLGMIGLLGRFPYILHCHGSDVRKITPFTRPMVERAIAGAGRVYYATPDLAKYVTAQRQDAEFLPNPVDAAEFRPAVPASSRNGVFICCSLTDIKGAGRIHRACRILARERPDVRVTAIAGGVWTPHFAELPNVTLIPRQPRRALPGIISEHGVAVGQAYLGAIGMSELEAMSCARPLVAWFTYNGSYGQRPPIVRAVDGVDLAANIARLVDDPVTRDELGASGREWVMREHSLDGAAAIVEEAALELLRRPPAAGAA